MAHAIVKYRPIITMLNTDILSKDSKAII